MPENLENLLKLEVWLIMKAVSSLKAFNQREGGQCRKRHLTGRCKQFWESWVGRGTLLSSHMTNPRYWKFLSTQKKRRDNAEKPARIRFIRNLRDEWWVEQIVTVKHSENSWSTGNTFKWNLKEGEMVVIVVRLCCRSLSLRESMDDCFHKTNQKIVTRQEVTVIIFGFLLIF